MELGGNPKILLLGANGQVGFELMLQDWGSADIFPIPRSEADLSQPSELATQILARQPSIVINAAADTAVDRAETELETSKIANAEAPKALATACHEVGARLIHFSTDYVFDGKGNRPYRESDAVGPINAYGRVKLEGERAVLDADSRHVVLRLSWVYANRGRNFALTMLRLAREGKPIRVVSDQFGSPTHAHFIASGTAAIVDQLLGDPSADGGVFHLSAGGLTSWHGFAEALLQCVLGDKAPKVEAIPSSAYPTPATRPNYSVLDNSRVNNRFGILLPSWQEQLTYWAGKQPQNEL